MPEVVIEQKPTLDLLNTSDPALSSTSDIPRIETKPDSQPAPKVEKPEAKAEAAVPPEKEGETTSESATEHTEEVPGEPERNKPPRGVQKRLDELVKQREDAERRVEAERQEKLRLLAMLEKGNAKPEDKPADEDPAPERPARSEFADEAAYESAWNEYADAKAAWTARREVKNVLAEEAKKAELREIEAGRQAAQQAYNARVEKASAKYSDYKQVAESADVQVSIPMAHAILNSEHGPEIQYFLGKNPAEAKRISALDPASQLVELGLIVGKLNAPEPKPEPKEPAKPAVSAAPKPIKPLTTGAGEVKKTPEEESMEEYAARRTKELAAERRPMMRR